MAEEQAVAWSVVTHEHRERSTDWYWTLGVLAVVGAGAAIFFGNILLALILLIGAGSIGFLAARGPREHMVRIDGKAITIDGTVYPYKSIHSFSIREHPYPELILSIHSVLTPRMLLFLDNTSVDTVRGKLSQHVEEAEYEPRLSDSLAEIFGL